MEEIQGATLKRAQQMAEAFAKDKTRDFLARFLEESGIFEDMWFQYKANTKEESRSSDEEYFNLLLDDYEMLFGQALAIAYALGYCDKAEGKSIKTLITSLKAVKK